MTETPTEGVSEEAALLAAVTNLTQVVETLNNTLKDDYPKRKEVERDFVLKTESNKRRRQVAFGIVVAVLLSYFFTVSTVNYCFLNGIPEDNNLSVCNVFPGYEKSFDNNRESVARFQKLLLEVEELKKEVGTR